MAAVVGGACGPTWSTRLVRTRGIPGEGRYAVDNDAGAGAKNITLQERRAIDDLDHHVPMILLDGRIYDRDLDRFLLDLPLNGVRSRHSLRAYGYDVMVWVRFLEQACSKGVWEAESGDITAFHRTRRREKAGARISAASWNRSVAAL